MIQEVFASPYEAARRHSGVIDRTDRGRIVVSGADRATYLQGLLTNDIASLRAGQGCYAAYLTAQGRMISDLFVYELGDIMLLVVPGDVKDAVLAKLDQFIFSEDVRLGDVTESFAQFAVVGPEAATVVARVLPTMAGSLAELPEHGAARASWENQPVIVTRVTDTGEPGFDLFVDRGSATRLQLALRESGAVDVDPVTADVIRIEAGIPVFHRDMDEETIPLEAGIESRAISFSKGCYVGQEVIIRVLHRGHGRVVRKLVGLTVEGDSVPSPRTDVLADDHPIGHITSSQWSPALKRPIALAYLHRDFVEPGTEVVVQGARATVTSLPFVR